jgi:hypothetical protein
VRVGTRERHRQGSNQRMPRTLRST